MAEVLAYITVGNMDEAERIGSMLVERRLAACVNMFDGMKSMYWWEGKLETSHEVVLIAKTRSDLSQTLIDAVVKAHSYDVPCVVTFPIDGGNRDFLDWINSETRRG